MARDIGREVIEPEPWPDNLSIPPPSVLLVTDLEITETGALFEATLGGRAGPLSCGSHVTIRFFRGKSGDQVPGEHNIRMC